jgi:hypothetical protein
MMMIQLTISILTLAFFQFAHAADPLKLANGAQIRSAIAGNTVEGSMIPSGRYTEFYAKNGTVKSKEYQAKWTIEGDSMCWVYEGQPKDCWSAAISGTSVKWVKDGKVLGTGTIVKGNPSNF